MTGNIIGEPFDPFVINQMLYRQAYQYLGMNENRTDEMLKYMSNRNAWVKLASGVNIIGKDGEERLKHLGLSSSEVDDLKGLGLAKKSILFNGMSEFKDNSYKQRSGVRTNVKYSDSIEGVGGVEHLWGNSAYGLGSIKQGQQPMPGITDLSIDCVNRGSIRKATVNIKAHNKFQFEIIETLYLRLGYSMLIEWGWDKYIDSNSGGDIKETLNTLIEGDWFNNNGTTQRAFLDKIEEYRVKYSGNYDGFFGKVNNFEWSLEPDGTYNIILHLVTMGDIIESLQVNLKPEIYKINNTTTTTSTASTNSSYLNSIKKDSNIGKNYETNSIVNWLYNTMTHHNRKIGTEGGVLDFFYLDHTIEEDKKYTNYVRLGKLLEKLEEGCIMRIKDTSPPSIPDTYEFDINTHKAKEEERKSKKKLEDLKGGERMITIDSSLEDNFISLDKYVIPIDPKVCIANITPFIDGNVRYKFLDYLEDFYVSDNEGINGNYVGYLMNLYINFEFIAGIMEQTTSKDGVISLYSFLEKLCDGINSSFGNYTKLEPIIKNDTEVVIIDQKSVMLPQSENNFSLELYGYNTVTYESNFVKGFKFNTKITPKLASQISIGATSGGSTSAILEGTAFSKWNLGLEDRFCREILDPFMIEEMDLEEKKTLTENLKTIFNNAAWVTDPKVTSPLPIFSSTTGVLFSLSQVTNKILNFHKNFTRDADYKNIEYEGAMIRGFTEKDWVAKAYKHHQRNLNKKLKEDKANYLDIDTYVDYIEKLFAGYDDGKPKYFDYNSGFIQRGKVLFNEYIKSLGNENFKETHNPSNLIGFIPLTLDVTIDGISGVKIWQNLRVEQKSLPFNYGETMDFVITQVNHKISKNNWETNLVTLTTSNQKITTKSLKTVKSNPIKNKTTASFNSNDPRYRTNLRLNPQTNKARDIAEKYLGRKVTYEEWNNLVAATAAEAGSDERERAYVMAVIINRARIYKKNILTILTAKKQFQAVTGLEREGFQPSPNFINANQNTSNAVFKGVEKYLATVPKNYEFFTSNITESYKKGTNIEFRNKMIANGGVIIGNSVFGKK